MDKVSAIAAKMNWDFDSVHVVRGEKARNRPNLHPQPFFPPCKTKLMMEGMCILQPDTSFFDPLKDKYSTHFLDEYSIFGMRLASGILKLTNGVAVEFEGQKAN
ncbi:hypothetical protein HanPI659440_Chr13g0504361 [Helianthus annuus]|nr:hypothetical protein HanPI659440_Chr13g0504361 [Helianthus annuus]